MFIQVIEGRTDRPEELHERLEIWQRDLMPGAIGYLGSTGGCTSSGDCILIARFESRDAAQQNSDRPEQGAWWAETEKCFDGPVRFHDTDDVQLMSHGELDSAHFVQVMEGHVSDRRQARPTRARRRPGPRRDAARSPGLGDRLLRATASSPKWPTSPRRPTPARARRARCRRTWHRCSTNGSG